jgi:hypothetical protein
LRDEKEAQACFRRAVEVARGQGAKAFEMRAAAALAERDEAFVESSEGEKK